MLMMSMYKRSREIKCMFIMSMYIMCRTINGLRESLSSDEITDPRLSLDPLLVDKVRFLFVNLGEVRNLNIT